MAPTFSREAYQNLKKDFLFYTYYSPRQQSKDETFATVQEGIRKAKEILLFGNDTAFLGDKDTLQSLETAIQGSNCYIGAILPRDQQEPIDRLAGQYLSVQLLTTSDNISKGFILIDDHKVVLWNANESTNFLPEYKTGVCYRQPIESKRLRRQLADFFEYRQSKLRERL